MSEGKKARRKAAKQLRRQEKDQRLNDIWAQFPPVNCKGLCTSECTVIRTGPLERERLRVAGTVMPPIRQQIDLMIETKGKYRCPALADNRCTAYDDRPAICRAYGAVDHPNLRCPHGCEPAGGLMPDEVARPLVEAARRI